MTQHKNRHIPSHRRVARLPPDNGNLKGLADGPTDVDSNTISPTPSASTPSLSANPPPSTPSQSPPQQPTKSTNPPKNDQTTSVSAQTPPSSTSISSTASLTTTSSTDTSTGSTSSTRTLKTAPTTITAPTVTRFTTSSGIGTLSIPSISSSASSTPSAAPSNGVGTGTIIGGVVGGLAAIGAIGIIVAFVLRRIRRARDDEDFNPDEFIRPATSTEPEYTHSSPFDPTPPSMAQFNREEVISTYSSPGMAGAGVFAYAQSQAQAGNASGAGLQGRPQYVYGQGYEADDAASDHAHGVYSSEPHPQSAYNQEAYGSYAYSTEGNQTVSSDNFGGFQHRNEDFAPLSSPYDNHGHPPALVAGAPAVAAGRSTTPRSMHDRDDAYGGF